ncbi:uncharacterized protein LOC128955970 [Oppia nitens]|uniref:uncharacterized protein LOC128955970 n=1 Tax=Oppia nitens TaxID=1686743 RepID=UPI0023DC465C|nr:uncharacterized protein LOC128955970 [Oppia nitens]
MKYSDNIARDCSTSVARASSILCRILPMGLRYDVSPVDKNDGKTVEVVFSSQSTDAIVYVTVVLIVYIVIFLILVITSYRKSAALRNSLNRHLRLQSANTYGATLIVDCDSKGRVRTDTIEDNIQEATQL